MVPDRDAPLSGAAASPARSTADAPAATVAVVRSDNRRGAVAEALALLDAEVRPILAGPAFVLARIGRRRRDSTDPAALSSLIDVLLAGGVGEVLVASGDRHASGGFERLGFVAECWGRPVRFLDLSRDEADWRGGPPRIAGTVARAGCRIALTPLAAVRGRGGEPASWRAARGAIHPDDRPGFDGRPIPGAWPDLSIVEGPVGRSVVAVAGLDALAVDAVVAELLGTERGLPGRVAVVGDPIGRGRRGGVSAVPGLRRDAGHGGDR